MAVLCFPKDTLALIKTAQDEGAPVRIVETVAAVNEQRKRAMARRSSMRSAGRGAGQARGAPRPRLQAEHDDMRDAPSIAIVQGLQDAGAKVAAYDPRPWSRRGWS